MERPKISDKKVSEYVDDLERQLNNFKSDETNAKLYLGVKRQIEDMAELLHNDIEVEIPETGAKKVVKLMDVHALSSKDDKFVDRCFKILDNYKDYIKDLKEVEELINPAVVEKLDRKESTNIADKFAFRQ